MALSAGCTHISKIGRTEGVERTYGVGFSLLPGFRLHYLPLNTPLPEKSLNELQVSPAFNPESKVDGGGIKFCHVHWPSGHAPVNP